MGFEGIEKYLPNIKEIKTISREKLDSHIEKWHLRFDAESAIPGIARIVFRPDMLRWEEVLICNSRELKVEWSIIPHYFKEYIFCSGETSYLDSDDGSIIDIKGIINIKPFRVLGIPEPAMKKIIETIEPFIAKVVEPNVLRFYRALKKMMDDKGCLYVEHISNFDE